MQVSHINAPILVVHGTRDEVIPVHHGRVILEYDATFYGDYRHYIALPRQQSRPYGFWVRDTTT